MSDALGSGLAAALGGAQREALERIYLRVRADMEWPLDAVGTGAAVTLKRVVCVRMALDGAETTEIAATSGLSAARVEAVLRNVAADGLKALYVDYAETLEMPDPFALWRKIWPLIAVPPSEQKIHAPTWFPSLVAEYLVQQGIVEDASGPQVKGVIERYRSKSDENRNYSPVDQVHGRQDDAKPWVTIVVFLVLAGLVAFLVQGRHLGSALAVGLFAALMGMILLKQALEWLLVRKTVAPKRERPEVKAPEPMVGTGRRVPAEKVKIVNVRSLPDVALAMDAIADDSNAMGCKPLRLLYLWVFAAQQDQRGYETEGWPQLGPVHLLLNATALTVNQLAKGADKILIKDTDALNKEIDAYTDGAGTLNRPNAFLSVDFGSKRPYKGYPIHTLVCNDTTWQQAFGRLASRCDLAVVNLSGYNPTHPGLEYEILHLLAGGPPTRFVFLYEPAVDADAVIESVIGLWGKVTADREEVPELVFVRVPDSQDVGYARQFQKMTTGMGWIADTLLKREGEYVPVASRVVRYLGV